MIKKMTLWKIFNFIAFVYCISVSMSRQEEYGLFFLPLIYSVLFTVCFRSRRLLGKTPGVTVIMGVMFLRYVILPIVLYSSGELSKYANSYEYMAQAIAVMIYEMIAIFAVLELSTTKSWRVYEDNYIKYKKNITVKTPILLVIIIFVILMGIYLKNKSILNRNIFIVNNIAHESEETIKDVSSLARILWQCMTTWLFVYGINKQKDKYKIDNKNIHVKLSIIFLLLFIVITYVGQTRISRWYTFVSSIAGVFILNYLFPDKKKLITRATIMPIVLLLVIATFLKSGLYVQRSGGGNSIFSRLITATTVDAYFAGPVSVNNAIGLSESTKVGLSNIIYDVFNNMPVINHFFNTKNSTAYLYNEYLGRIFDGSRGDQIIPLIGQSGIFFTWILSPLLSCISVILLRLSDKKYMETYSYTKYVWGFVGVWFGVVTILNMTINLSWLYIRILPMFAMFWAMDKISKKKR